jgi:tetratricopeptide (TPR) repeat protein
VAPSTPASSKIGRSRPHRASALLWPPPALINSALLAALTVACACSNSTEASAPPGATAETAPSAEATQRHVGWDTLIYPKRHLSVAFPSGWTLGENTGTNDGDGLGYWELQAEDSDTLYYMSVEDMGGVVEPESGGFEELFNQFVGESLRSFGGELLGMAPLTLRGYPGIGYDIAVPTEDPDTTFRLSGRMYLVGSHRILAFAYTGDPVADEIELFLNSLELSPSVDGWARQAYEEGWADLAMANVAWRDDSTAPSRKREAIALYAKALESGVFEGAFAGGIEDRRARIFFLLGDEDEALASLDHAKDLGFETLASAQIRGLIYFQQESYAKAAEQYERVIAEGNGDPGLLYLRVNAMAGHVGQEAKRVEQGQGKRGQVDVLVNNLVEQVDAALALAPDHSGLRVWHALLRLRNADRHGATVDMRRALASDPASFEASLEWSWELLGEEFGRQASAYASYVESTTGSDGVLARLAGELRLVAREYDAALTHFERLSRAGDARPELLCKHAGLLNRVHREREALTIYARAHSAAPDDEPCSNSHAWLLATSTDDALRDGARAVALVEPFVYAGDEPLPRDELSSAVVDTLAAAYAEAQRWDEAVATQELAIRLAHEKGYSKEGIEKFERRLADFKARKPWRERWSEDN